MNQKTQDSGSQGTEIEGAPSPTGSAQGSDSGGSGQVALSKEQWDALQARLDAIERRTQSDKDRAVRKANERLDKLEEGVRPLLERAAKEGKSVSDVLTELDQQDEIEFKQAMREMLSAIKTGTLPIPAAGKPAGGGSDAAQVFVNKGLDLSEPDVQAALAEANGKSALEAELIALRLKDRKTSQPNPKPAQGSAISGGAPQTQSTADEIERGYREAVSKVRRGDIENLHRVKQEWMEKARKAGFLLNI